MADQIDNRQPAANDDTMSLEAAADFLLLGYKSMKELVETGEVPALCCNQKHTVLLRADLIEYIHTKGREQAEKRRRRKTAAAIARLPENRRGRAPLPDLDLFELTVGKKNCSP